MNKKKLPLRSQSALPLTFQTAAEKRASHPWFKMRRMVHNQNSYLKVSSSIVSTSSMPTSATLFFRRYLSSNSFFRLPKVPTTMSMGTLISVVSFELISYTVNYTLAPQQLGEQYFPLWRPAPSPPLDHRQTSPGHWSKFKGSCQTKFTLQGWLFWNRVKQGFPEAVNWKHCNFKVVFFKTR